MFQRRDVAWVKADQEHLRPFPVLVSVLVVVQILLGSAVFDTGYERLLHLLVSLLVVGLLVPHVAPVTRLVERMVARYLGVRRGGGDNTLRGDVDGHVVQAGQSNGPVHITQPPSEPGGD